MKPKTKIQKEVAALSAKLPPLTSAQMQYAEIHSHEYKGFFSMGQLWCTHCGRFSGDATPLVDKTKEEKRTCPFCGKELTVSNSRKKNYHEKRYFTIITTFHGWQVLRHFETCWNVRKGEQPYFEIDEAVQKWIKEDGTKVIMARPLKPLMARSEQWDFNKPIEVRRENAGYYSYYGGDKYTIWAATIYPRYSVLPKFKKYGFTLEAADKAMPPCELMRTIVEDREAEYLIKTKQYNVCYYFKYKTHSSLLRYKPALKICLRNKYHIEDVGIWKDYIDNLLELGLDIHNAHYVCPADLKKAHDEMQRRADKVRAKRKAEELRKTNAQWDKEYRLKKGAYFGICFGDENIQIAVLTSLDEFLEEGTVMHHCVYSNGYYKKDDALILSARDPQGNRIETIEIDLNTFRIVQSRGKCNQSTPQHDRIIELVKSNMDSIKRIRTAA